MKKYIYILVALVVAGFAASCESNLDIPQKRVIDFSTFYENANEENAKELIGGVYRLLYDQVYNPEPSVMLDALSDDCWAGGGSFMDNSHGLQHVQAYKLTSSNCDCLDKVYENCYKVIYYSNCIIEKIPETSDAEINRIKAEAKFLRALATFRLIRFFGTPPFVDHIPSSDEYYPSNGDTKTMIDWCISNMKEAAEVVPALSGIGTQKQYGGRISKHGALAYVGKVGLWYGTRYNDPSYVAAAVEPLKTVVNSGLYGLVDDMSILFRKQADFCKEYVFEHEAADNDGYLGSYQSDNRNAWYTWANMWLPKGNEVEGWGWDHPTASFAKWFEQHEGGIEQPRFKAFIRTYDQVMAMEYTGEKGVKSGASLAYHEGYFRMLEMHYEDAVYQTSGFWKMSMYNLPYLRYSEVLLMYAEAQFLANGDSDGTGLKALNQVRKRAQIPELTTMTYQDIKDERRAELWGQRERFFDLQRWGDAPTALKDKAKTSPAFKGYKEGTTEWDIDYSAPVNGQGWQDKYMLLPFPYKQIAANPNLKQNPGW